jgi:hypothetical protein
MATTHALAAQHVATWVGPMARVGYAAKGVVYLLVGYIAARAALAAGSPTGGAGALREALGAGGPWLVLAIGIGLLAHVAWRAVQALLDPENPRDGFRAGTRLFHLVSGLVYGSLALSAFRLWQGRRDAGDDNEAHFAALLMAQPFGRWLVGLVGLVIVGYGIHQFVQAWRGDVARHLGIGDADRHRVVVAIGRFGTAARGVVFGLIGCFFIDAARRFDPNQAGGMDDALRWLGHGWLLAVVAFGLVAYGVFQLAKARYRVIDSPG